MMKKRFVVYGVLTFCIFLTWFFLEPKKTVFLPIRFSVSDTPFTPIEVDGTRYWIRVDLGMSQELELSQEILGHIPHKKDRATVEFLDFLGNSYQSSSYLIPSIQLKNLRFENVIATEHNEQIHLKTQGHLKFNKEEKNRFDTSIKTQSFLELSSKIGRLGIGLFQRVNLLLDFKNSLMYACTHKIKNPSQIKRYKAVSFIKVPFEKVDRLGIVLKIETDYGTGRFLLDTGSTFTFCRPIFLGLEINDSKSMSYVTSKKFSIEGFEYPEQACFSINISDDLNEIDGILGMDFLKRHVIFIDFTHNMLYMSHS